MDAINGGDRLILELASDCFVGGEHEFFDQLVRLVIFDPLETNGDTLFIQPQFHFREIKVERSVFESFLAQERREFPGCVQAFT